MHTLNLRLSPDEIGWIAADAEDRFLVVDDILLPLYRQFADKHAFEKVIVYPFSGAPVDTARPARLRGAPRRRRRRPLRLRGARRERPGVDVLHVGHHRPAEGRRLLASLDRAAHARRLPRRELGLQSADVVLPVTPMFHANCWGLPYGAVMTGTKMVFPGPHLHPDDLLDLIRPSRRRSRSACRRSGSA
jgi:fatty-acyl-CoA synthase